MGGNLSSNGGGAGEENTSIKKWLMIPGDQRSDVCVVSARWEGKSSDGKVFDLRSEIVRRIVLLRESEGTFAFSPFPFVEHVLSLSPLAILPGRPRRCPSSQLFVMAIYFSFIPSLPRDFPHPTRTLAIQHFTSKLRKSPRQKENDGERERSEDHSSSGKCKGCRWQQGRPTCPRRSEFEYA